jgi:hypothetical protein
MHYDRLTLEIRYTLNNDLKPLRRLFIRHLDIPTIKQSLSKLEQALLDTPLETCKKDELQVIEEEGDYTLYKLELFPDRIFMMNDQIATSLIRKHIQKWEKGCEKAKEEFNQGAASNPADLQQAKCSRCGDSKRVFITDQVVQGQDYGPETEGHYEPCPNCSNER